MGLSCSSSRIHQILKINDKKNKHCIYEAIRHCDALTLARLLLYQTDVNIYNKWGLSPLHIACEIGNVNLVQIIFAMGADFNLPTTTDQGSIPPLVFAAANGHSSVVQLLLEKGASVDATDGWGCTALFKAATYNHLDCVKLLLNYGANPDKSNRWGAIPLQYAAHQGHHKIIRALVKSGCDIHKVGEESVPPALIVASMRGYHRCTAAILEAGAKVDTFYNNDGETALFHAIRYCQHALNEYSVNSQATISDRLKCIQTLLANGAMVTSSTVYQLCAEGYFPNFACESSQGWELRLIRVVLRAMAFRGTAEEISALRALYREITQTMSINIPLMRKLTNLICSVGLDLNKKDTEAIHYALSNKELERVRTFMKSPRSLMDNCRLVVRSQMAGNVIASADGLPLPTVLKDYITMASHQMYSLG